MMSTKKPIIAVFVTFCLSCLFPALVAAKGRPYELIIPPVPVQTQAQNKVNVTELFWYSCPSCYYFDPSLRKWVETKADYIEFVRMPAVYNNARGLNLAKAFYTAEMLGVLYPLHIHEALFHAWHVDKQRFQSIAQVRQFFVEHGVTEKDFDNTFFSFDVDRKIRQARILTTRYGVNSVPTIVVNGKYRLQSHKAGGHKKMLKLVDKLAAEEWSKIQKIAEKEKKKESSDTKTKQKVEKNAPINSTTE
jgi:thiol:disulfide interchange protein DsbA